MTLNFRAKFIAVCFEILFASVHLTFGCPAVSGLPALQRVLV